MRRWYSISQVRNDTYQRGRLSAPCRFTASETSAVLMKTRSSLRVSCGPLVARQRSPVPILSPTRPIAEIPGYRADQNALRRSGKETARNRNPGARKSTKRLGAHGWEARRTGNGLEQRLEMRRAATSKGSRP